MRLTKTQREILEYAARLPVDDIELAMPDGVGQRRSFASLERLGLLKCGGTSRHVDTGREGDGFVITDEGKRALRQECKHDSFQLSGGSFAQYTCTGELHDPTAPDVGDNEPISWRCFECGEYASLGPANDEPEQVRVEMRAAEISAAWKGRREPFDLPLTDAEKSGCDKWPYLDPTADELSGFLAVQIINHNAEQAGHTFTGQHRAAIAAHKEQP
jgi:hypothetical protein